ncbi:hypothetical protein [Ruminococcus sp. HUN007]|uniref:hypothetical protein n=1 Tax=Ruminococcus sp. HUN007 TaxID=1514668 RepID=UPI0005D1D910|nr:hypothetical protein [Ruminococcus sp. HUN007]
MKIINMVYDRSFKRMLTLSEKMLVKLVNKVFDKQFPLNSKVTYLDRNSKKADGSKLEKDLYFSICGERFHIEAQAYQDDMIIRLFAYAVSSTHDGYEIVDDTHSVFRMPMQAVVFLKDTDRSKDKLYIKLILPDEQEIEYSVHAVRALGYSPAELVENDLEILLPFQIIRLYRRARNYDKYSSETKEKFLADFSEMCNEVVTTIDRLHDAGKITNDEYHEMLDITRTLEKHVYKHVNDIFTKGADKMLQDKFMFASDELIAEAIAVKEQELAKAMILNDEPLEKIEQYTGLNVAALKPIAQTLGKKLVV